MKPTTSTEIRQAFLAFFTEIHHHPVASAPLPNFDNPTLLFNNAGMNQFVDVFLGNEKRDYTRAASSQKCMRVHGKHNDLENVGPSPRHHTFFEMLGNFSFGDYFKAEAIDYAWMFLTDVIGLPAERIWATVYLDDDDAAKLWEKYLPADKIKRFGESDNYWTMGDTGPNGPCSELHYYQGDLDNIDISLLNNDDDADEQFLEIWNLVFMQYDTDEDGVTTPLPNPSIDTGLGLERLVRILQNGASNYDTDLFLPAMARAQELLEDSDEDRARNYVGYRVIADHGRAATFMIADGVRPGSAGAGYVLRMIIRRAARFGRQIGFGEPFLAEIASVFIDTMREAYPELEQRRDPILRTITDEETRFARTIDGALVRLLEITDQMRLTHETEVSGERAFNLYATYGLPLEITRDLVKQWNFTVDEAGYTEARRLHAVASGSGAFDQYQTGNSVYGDLLHDLHESGQLEGGVDHDPYTGARMGSEIVGIIRDGESVKAIGAGEKAEIITAATPFYVESGGEVSDTGQIVDAESGAIFTVTHTHRPVPGLVAHIGTAAGDFVVDREMTLIVENGRRSDIRRNHTATHLLHRELRAHLGKHVTQQGSLVAPDRLRFDFSHGEAVDKATLATIEADINAAIMENMPIKLKYMGQKEAVNAGAMALFGEKYGDIVRTVTVGEGDEPYSMELCGGLHVAETNDIGQFIFISKGSAAAGVRRVEAVTGRRAQELISERLQTLDRVAALLNAPIAEMEARLESLLTNHHTLQKEMEKAQRKLAQAQFTELLAQMQTVKGVPVLTAQIEGVDVDTLREMTDWFKDKVGSGTAVLATVNNGKPIIIAAVTDDLIKRGIKAGDIVREVAKMVGGGGGGRPNLAQAGGRDASKLPEALAHVTLLVEKNLRD